MNTETLDQPTTAKPATLTLDELEALKGASVQINHSCNDMLSGEPHMWAGKHGTLVGLSPLGGVKIAVGKREKLFDRGDFVVTAKPPTFTGDPGPDNPLEGIEPPIAEGQPITLEWSALPGHTETNLVNVAPLQAINSPTNPRRRRGLDLPSLRAMADSITAHGLGNPILVRPLPAERLEETSGMEPRPAYEVIAGERRWRAAQMAELPTMPMVVRPMSDNAVLEMQLVENIEREDLDPMEEAEGFALLRHKLGYTVEQIAQRMGKGRGESYVRKRMKLLELAPEGREGMFDGTLMLSVGLLVAKYPPEKHAQAVKIVKSMETRGTDGKPIPAPFRAVALALYRKLNTLLATAAFDTTDPVLVMTAGPCSACPKRSRADSDLFAESLDAGEDSCMDNACWEDKKTAHVQRIHANARERGIEVMDAADAAEVFPSPYSSFTHGYGYTPITQTAYKRACDDGEERDVTFEDALRAQGRKAPKPIIIINPHTSKAVEVIPNALAETLLPKEEQEAIAQRNATVAQRHAEAAKPLPPEHQALRDSNVRRALFIRLFDSMRGREPTLQDLQIIAISMLCSTDEAKQHTEDYMGWGDADDQSDDPGEYIRQKIETLDADQLGLLITMAAMETALDCYDGHLRTLPDQTEFFTAQGIDILAVRDKVAEDLARQQRSETTEATAPTPNTWPFGEAQGEGGEA